jgi:hypothetical protein
MKRRFLLALLFVACAPPEEPIRPDLVVATAHRRGAAPIPSYEWTLSVVYPDKERKTFIVSRQGQDIPMRSDIWTCKIDPVVERQGTNGTPVEAAQVSCRDGRSLASVSGACAGEERIPGGLVIGEGGAVHYLEITCHGS